MTNLLDSLDLAPGFTWETGTATIESGSWSQVVPANRLRVCLIVTFVQQIMWLWPNEEVSGQGGIRVGDSGSFMDVAGAGRITASEYPGIITEAWYGRGNASSADCNWVDVSFDSRKLERSLQNQIGD